MRRTPEAGLHPGFERRQMLEYLEGKPWAHIICRSGRELAIGRGQATVGVSTRQAAGRAAAKAGKQPEQGGHGATEGTEGTEDNKKQWG